MAIKELQDLLITYEARLVTLPLKTATRAPIHRHPSILYAWSNAVHQVIDKCTPQQLSQLALGATKNTIKVWTTDIALGKLTLGPSKCTICDSGSDECWRCQLEADILERLEQDQQAADNDVTGRQDAAGKSGKPTMENDQDDAEYLTPMEKLLAKLPPVARARLEAAKQKNQLTEKRTMNETTLIAECNLSPRDALGATNPERITGLMLLATAQTGACKGPCQNREYVACLCSLNYGPEHYHSKVLQKWSANNRALQVDMRYFDRFMEFKIRKSMYKSCKVCHQSLIMIELPLNRRYCMCDWDTEDQLLYGLRNDVLKT